MISRTLAVLVTVTFVTLFPTPSTAAQDLDNVIIGTGPAQDMYFTLGNALCRQIEKPLRTSASGGQSLPPLKCAAPATPGSLANLQSLRSGRMNFGIVQSDWQHHVYRGTKKFAGKSMRRLRAVMSLHRDFLHLVAARDTAVQNFSALEGKVVNVGRRGSGERATFEVLLDQNGRDINWFGRSLELDTVERTVAVCSGDVDVAGYMMGVPSGLLQQVSSACKTRLLSIESETLNELVARYPFYSVGRIEKGTFAHMPNDVTTFAVYATLVTTSDTSSDVVQRVTEAVFERLEDFRKSNPALSKLRPNEMVTRGNTAPLHPGAVRYYMKRGWMDSSNNWLKD